MKALIIAAPQSGSGKTTVSLGLMAALTRRGQRVAPFKTGPDFIDPGYHRLVTGRPSINLDGWLCPSAFVQSTFHHHATTADIALIEGAMGLFDGLGASTQEGSTAQIARLTGAAVLLVVNARGMAASAAALVAGFVRFDPAVRLAGVIFNNVGSARHGQLLAQALTEYCPQVPCLGTIPRDEGLVIPSRHLGLVTVEDNPLPPAFVERLADTMERHLDLAALEARAACEPTVIAGVPVVAAATGERVLLAVARDAAFCFLYEDNLRLLREAGAAVVFFSPLKDRALPEGCQGVYLPGGYPELYREELSANRPMLEAIRQAVNRGLPVYGECGGLVYLTGGVMAQDEDRLLYPFAGIFPTRARMGQKRAALGYREVELTRDALVGREGGRLRGHEYHYSRLEEIAPRVGTVYRMARPGEDWRSEGFISGSCLASYVHLHFGSHLAIAPSLLAACRTIGHR